VTVAERYVAAAYLVVVVLVLTYVLIIAMKLQRLERALHELSAEASANELDREAVPSDRGRHHMAEAQMR